MDLKNWYARVREQLDRLDFPALWAGFAPCPFALYTHDTAVLNGEVMPRPAEFYGNTSVCRQGEYLAIWNMEADPPADVAGLAASLVHEMFHSFQFRCGEQAPLEIAAQRALRQHGDGRKLRQCDTFAHTIPL